MDPDVAPRRLHVRRRRHRMLVALKRSAARTLVRRFRAARHRRRACRFGRHRHGTHTRRPPPDDAGTHTRASQCVGRPPLRPDTARAKRRALLAAAATTNALVLGTRFAGTSTGRIFRPTTATASRPNPDDRRRSAVGAVEAATTRPRPSALSATYQRQPQGWNQGPPQPPPRQPPPCQPPTAVPTAAAAVPTGGLHAGSRGDRRRLDRSGSGRGDRCGTDSDRGSARRQHRCDVLQSNSKWTFLRLTMYLPFQVRAPSDR